MSVISVCKNIIASNNKRHWIDPDPAIRVSNTKSGKVIMRTNCLKIVDREGREVGRVISSIDGNPVVSCGAKVAILTKYPVENLDELP